MTRSSLLGAIESLTGYGIIYTPRLQQELSKKVFNRKERRDCAKSAKF